MMPTWWEYAIILYKLACISIGTDSGMPENTLPPPKAKPHDNLGFMLKDKLCLAY